MIEELKPCRKCGGTDIEMWDGRGTQAEMCCNNCGEDEGLQVSDLLSYEELYGGECDFDMKSLSYPPHVVQRVNRELIKEWNTRAEALDDDSVRIPTNEDQAALMALLGRKYLESHAPHRLKENVSNLLEIKKKLQDVLSKLETGATEQSAIMDAWDSARGLLLECPESDFPRTVFEMAIESITDDLEECLEMINVPNSTPLESGWKTIDSAPKDGTRILL